MSTRFVGGVLDGQTTEATAPILVQPVVTPEWARADEQWYARYGLADLMAWLDEVEPDPPLPPRPSIPREEYRLERMADGEVAYVLSRSHQAPTTP